MAFRAFLPPVLLAAGFLALAAQANAGQPTSCSVNVAEALRHINAARAAGQR